MSCQVKQGNVVLVGHDCIGVVRFLGHLQGSKSKFVGLELTDASGTCDGSVYNRRYFTTRPRHGIFVPVTCVNRVLSSWELLEKLTLQHGMLQNVMATNEALNKQLQETSDKYEALLKKHNTNKQKKRKHKKKNMSLPANIEKQTSFHYVNYNEKKGTITPSLPNNTTKTFPATWTAPSVVIPTAHVPVPSQEQLMLDVFNASVDSVIDDVVARSPALQTVVAKRYQKVSSERSTPRGSLLSAQSAMTTRMPSVFMGEFEEFRETSADELTDDELPSNEEVPRFHSEKIAVNEAALDLKLNLKTLPISRDVPVKKSQIL